MLWIDPQCNGTIPAQMQHVTLQNTHLQKIFLLRVHAIQQFELLHHPSQRFSASQAQTLWISQYFSVFSVFFSIFQYFQYSSVFSAFLVRSFFPFSICSFASQAQTLDCIQNRVTFVRSCSHVRWKFFLFAPSHFYNFPKK